MAERDERASSAETRFDTFVTARSAHLLRTAWLLTGDRSSAQDLVQSALLVLWTRWAQVQRQDAPEAYLRRVMMSTYLTGRRRRWNREAPSDLRFTDDIAGRDDTDRFDVRLVVAEALRGLSRGQRAVVVLRYFDDLSEAQTAAALGCSVGTVKSQASRALERLRVNSQLTDLWDGASDG